MAQDEFDYYEKCLDNEKLSIDTIKFDFLENLVLDGFKVDEAKKQLEK